jgi:hypothetical protein
MTPIEFASTPAIMLSLLVELAAVVVSRARRMDRAPSGTKA